MGKVPRAKFVVSGAIAGIVMAAAIVHLSTAHADPSSSPEDMSYVDDFASQVETLAEAQFADTFAGSSLSSDGVLTVYTTDPSDSSLSDAIAAVNPNSYPVDYVSAPLSWNQLDDLSASMIPDLSALVHQDGVDLDYWAPDPADGDIDVTLWQPTDTDLAQVSQFYQPGGVKLGNDPVDVSDYADAASSAISTVVGSGFTVDPTFDQPTSAPTPTGSATPVEPPPDTPSAAQPSAPGTSASSEAEPPGVQPAIGIQPAVGRANGVSPFVGGVDISRPNGDKCESGFPVIGNKSLEPFMLTAGHCGSATWSTPSQTIGTTSTVYMENSTKDDFQTIRVNTGVRGSVDADGSKQYPLLGTRAVQPGDKVVIDSRPNNLGTQYGQIVKAVDGNMREDTPDHTSSFAVQHVILIDGLCLEGDSGGPIFSRVPDDDTKAYAVGTMIGFVGDCAAEAINEELKVSNTSLVVNGAVLNK